MSHALFSQEFQRRLAEYGAGLQAGAVSPAARYRLEGFAQAGVALGLTTAAELQDQVNRALALPDAVLPEAGTLSDTDVDAPVCLPFRLPVAPVYPSTR